MNNGIVEACTGVMRLKPILDTASNIHSASGGVRASHARVDCGFEGCDEGTIASAAIEATYTVLSLTWTLTLTTSPGSGLREISYRYRHVTEAL